ncbi:hypothetical protein BOTBODRAFT_182469 [Botryobasidium botryosum FD-172 SS1]|uniref:Uncharacterized protein n=1 Tax=Botryobasidium botryosum (strain FD-172 SS1) TaxID=930990 RepID=A0A067LRB6_BOTB1|nr:hypothetical protein BOTBODRAFT_182469 [Botryobasidium botryosum FD-172 SS1]
MLARSDLPNDFRKEVYNILVEHVGGLTSLLANTESTLYAVLTIDSKGHASWRDGSAPAAEGSRDLLVIIVGQLDEGIKLGCYGNKARDTALITDKTRVRYSLPLVVPTKPPKSIVEIFNDQLVSFKELVAACELKYAPLPPGTVGVALPDELSKLSK